MDSRTRSFLGALNARFYSEHAADFDAVAVAYQVAWGE